MKVYYLVSLWLSGVIAVLSAVALPLWLLGVPGVDNAYARGWKIGLNVVLVYPLSWIALFVLSRILKRQFTGELQNFYLGFGSAWSAALVIAGVGLFYAFKVMSRS